MAYAILNSVSDFYADASTVTIPMNITVQSASATYSIAVKKGSSTCATATLGAQSVGTRSVSVSLSSSQRTSLLSSFSNVASFTATIVLTTTDNGSTQGTSSATCQVMTSEATSKPTLNAIGYQDTNANSVAVTGDNQKILFIASNIRFTPISGSAKNGATLKYLEIQSPFASSSSNGLWGDWVYTQGYLDWGGLAGSTAYTQVGQNITYTFRAVDSRGYKSDPRTVTFMLYAYSTAQISTCTVTRNASDHTKVDIRATGTWANVFSNTLSLKYKSKLSSASTYGAETTVTPTTSGDTWTYSATIGTFAEDSAYDFSFSLFDAARSVGDTRNVTVADASVLIAFREQALGIGAPPANNNSQTVDIADTWALRGYGKYNSFTYEPYSFRTTGGAATLGWARIARITVTGVFVASTAAATINFTVQAGTLTYAQLQINFVGYITSGSYVEPTGNNWLCNPARSDNIPFIQTISTDSTNAIGVYDVYFPKGYADDVLTVYTECSALLQDRATIEYSDNLLSSMPSSNVRPFTIAPIPILTVGNRLTLGSTNADAQPNTADLREVKLADTWKLTANGKNNTFAYMPNSFQTGYSSGNAGYLKIAQITIMGTWAAGAITFTVKRLLDNRPVTLNVRFANENTTDPSSCVIYYDGLEGTYTANPFKAFAYKEDTSVWGIYVNKCSNSDNISVTTYIPRYMEDRCTITYVEARQASVPSGATMAIPIAPVSQTVTFTKSSGSATADTISFRRQGALCILSFKVTNPSGASAVSAGSDAWVGTVDSPKPITNVSACAYSGSACLVARLNTSNNITVRVTGASFATNTDSTRFTLVYFSTE